MQSITKKEFFRLLINGLSAKLGKSVYQGAIEMSDTVAKDLLDSAASLRYRKVTHTQSNAIKFEDESWMYFDKPKNCDSRKTYRHEIDGKVIITLVDHRPEYKNPLGALVSEQTLILAYEIAK